MPRKAPAPPEFRDLSKAESESLLERNHVGRLAFSFHDAVDVRPLHYVFDDGWIFGRTSPSDKLITLRHNQWIAFEVDEISGPFDWESVVVRGTFYRVEDEGSVHDKRLYQRALSSIRKLVPQTLTEKDPTAFRTALFGIHIESMTGRSSSTHRT
jgi:nitroimidazol reductase NimA-like FMN-containing flavoprotein (pyridoxamine 5'-phosphate oxidase superfamily)